MSHQNEFVFLRFRNKCYTYADLYRYAKSFVELKLNTNSRVLIPNYKHPETVLCIASCWILGIPYLVIPDDVAVSDVPNLTFFSHFLTISDSHPENLPHHITTCRPYFSDSHARLHLAEENEIFAWILTSGTTGAPKQIPLRRRQMLHAFSAGVIHLSPKPGDYWLLQLPLSHMGGQNIVLKSLLSGSAIHLGTEDLEHEIRSFRDISYLSLVPTQLKRLLPDTRNSDLLSTYSTILIGGGPYAAELFVTARKKGIHAIGSYGMTETCGVIVAHRGDETPADLESAGFILGSNAIRITDEHGLILPPYQSGNIELQGPQIPDMSDIPEKFTQDGWFITGDFGYITDDSRLFVEARRTDLIISGGKNIRPIEIERHLERMDEVLECVVFSQKDDEWGQIAVARIVVKSVDSSYDELEKRLKSHLKENLPSWKIPKRWIFQKEALPRNAMGKILRPKS